MSYLKWDSETISDFSPEKIEAMYTDGFVFTRVEKGAMNRTRSFRIDLAKFELSSENRRILRKAEHLAMTIENLPYAGYNWKIGKLAKDFYEKFGDKVFSANKIRELMTDESKSNYNRLFIFTDKRTKEVVGYVIAFKSTNMLHYSYPFYIEDSRESSRGLSMMTMVAEYVKQTGKGYLYLGSLSRPSDTYKLQFKGGEWFDGERWRTDIEPLKNILK
jgi:arginyl-tRNA--protein-N-Asp/Glu arginylyltransferase